MRSKNRRKKDKWHFCPNFWGKNRTIGILKTCLFPCRCLLRVILSFKTFISCFFSCGVGLSLLFFVTIQALLSLSSTSKLADEYRLYHFNSIVSYVETELEALELLVEHTAGMAVSDVDFFRYEEDGGRCLINTLSSTIERYPTLTKHIAVSLFPDTRFGGVTSTDDPDIFIWFINENGRTNVTYVAKNDEGLWEFLDEGYDHPFEPSSNDTWAGDCNNPDSRGRWLDLFYNDYHESSSFHYFSIMFSGSGECVGFVNSATLLNEFRVILMDHVSHSEQLHFIVDLKSDKVVISSHDSSEDILAPTSDHPIERYRTTLLQIAGNSTASVVDALRNIAPNCNLQNSGNGAYSSYYIHYKRIQKNGLDLLFVSRFGRSQFLGFFDVSMMICFCSLLVFISFVCCCSYFLHTVFFWPLNRITNNLEPMSHMELKKVSTRHCSMFYEIRKLQNAMNRSLRVLKEFKSFLPMFLLDNRRMSRRMSRRSSFRTRRRNSVVLEDYSFGSVSKNIPPYSVRSSTSANNNGENLDRHDHHSVISHTNTSSSGSLSSSDEGSEGHGAVFTDFKHAEIRGLFGRNVQKNCGIIFFLYMPGIYQMLHSSVFTENNISSSSRTSSPSSSSDEENEGILGFFDLFFSFLVEQLRRYEGELFDTSFSSFKILFPTERVRSVFIFCHRIKSFFKRSFRSNYICLIHQSDQIFTGIIGSRDLKKKVLVERNFSKIINQVLTNDCFQRHGNEVGESIIFITETMIGQAIQLHFCKPHCGFLLEGLEGMRTSRILLFELLEARPTKDDEWLYKYGQDEREKQFQNLAKAVKLIRDFSVEHHIGQNYDDDREKGLLSEEHARRQFRMVSEKVQEICKKHEEDFPSNEEGGHHVTIEQILSLLYKYSPTSNEKRENDKNIPSCQNESGIVEASDRSSDGNNYWVQ